MAASSTCRPTTARPALVVPHKLLTQQQRRVLSVWPGNSQLRVPPIGIRVNALSPGPIETPGSEGAPSEMVNYIIHEMQVNGRPLTPMDIAYGLLFLASDESRFITAIDMPVDGGTSGARPGPNF